MTAPSRPGLTYWRCPECGTRVGFPGRFGIEVPSGTLADGWQFEFMARARLSAAERLVEAHEARHGIGAA